MFDAPEPEQYRAYCLAVDEASRWPTQFRLCETPIWLDENIYAKVINATGAIVHQLRTGEFNNYSLSAVPQSYKVPNCDGHPNFIQIDFAICEEGGRFVPKLIELQGFASMFCFQVLVDRALKQAGIVPRDRSCYHSGLNEESYLELLKRIILKEHAAEEVVLLELHPERQRTRIDFSATEKMIGIRTVCITDVERQGGHLYHQGKQIKRIYNRVILDELLPLKLQIPFDLRQEVDVTWATHPDWFLRISKHSMPFLQHESVPECHLLSRLKDLPYDLENWVLKPLYSFAGAGVKLHLTPSDLDQIEQPEHFILQRKVAYSDFLQTPDGPRKVELRVMVLWDEEPIIANSLVRVSRTGFSSVSANRADSFVGATTAYHA